MCIYVGETALAEFGYASFRHLEHKNKQMELFISYRLCSITSSNQWEEHLHRLPHFYHTSFIRPYHLKSPSHDDDLILDVLYDHKRAFIKKRDAVHTVLPWIMVSSCVMNKHHGGGGIHDFINESWGSELSFLWLKMGLRYGTLISSRKKKKTASKTTQSPIFIRTLIKDKTFNPALLLVWAT